MRRRPFRSSVSHWNSHKCQFDLDVFVGKLCRQISLGALLTRAPPIQINRVGLGGFDVPVAVQVFLGKGDKLCPVRHLPSFFKFERQFDQFELACARHCALGVELSRRSDPLIGLRRPHLKKEALFGRLRAGLPVSSLPVGFPTFINRVPAELFSRWFTLRAQNDKNKTFFMTT